MRSLSHRLTISLALSLGLFFIVLSAVVTIEVRTLSEETIVTRLEHDTEEILVALNIANDQMTIDWSHIPSIYKRPFSGHYFQVQSSDLTLRSRSLWDETIKMVPAGSTREMSGPIGQQLIVLSRSYIIHGLPATILIAEDITPIESTSWQFLKRLLLFSLVTLLLLLALQVWSIRRGLEPVKKLRDELRRLETGEADSLKQPVPSEIQPLVDELNRLIVIMRQRLGRLRNAIGNLAHALKTPLTVTTQILEREPEATDREQLLQQIELIQQRIQHELALARTAGQSPGGLWREPLRDLQDLTATMQTIHHKEVELHYQLPEKAIITADREDMMELTGNLLDNACKWAQNAVMLSIRETPEFSLMIEDDGPGMAEELRESVLQRGVRADESREGHGLGLAIVNDIVQAYEGSLSLERSPTLGGLRIIITLPAIGPGVRSKR